MQQHEPKKTSIISLCAPSDRQGLQRWEAHLQPLEQTGILSFWSVDHLEPGADRSKLLSDHLNQADLFVLLLSADFFNDSECIELMEHALLRQKLGTVRLIPLLLHPVAYQETKLATLTPLPLNRRPVALWDNCDAAFDDCVRGLRRILGRPVTSPLTHKLGRKPIEEQNRERMLRRLRHFYEDLFVQSLAGMTKIELGLCDKPDAVKNAATFFFQTTTRVPRLLPATTSILGVYDEAIETLLILGAPGAGKSTLLVELAKQLIIRAETDEAHPLPVLLPLSSWATKRCSLQDWMAEQVAQIYDIPHQLARQWIDEDQLLPLLDGLDEMNEATRPACIAAINAYHRDHLLLPLVVCSRQAEYEQAAKQQRLVLANAIMIQPLTHEHIQAYLKQMGKPLSALRRALSTNPTLAQITTTPLMVHVLVLTYQGTSLRQWSTQHARLEQQIWTDYLARMTERKANAQRYPLPQTRSWLQWLAHQMRTHNQTVFYLEHLQPDWLSCKQQKTYAWLAIRLPALVIGILVSLLVQVFLGNDDLACLLQSAILGGLLAGIWREPTPQKSCHQEHEKYLAQSLLISTCIGLIYGLCFGFSLGSADILSHWQLSYLCYGIAIALASLLPAYLLTLVTASGTSALRQWKQLVDFVSSTPRLSFLLMAVVSSLGFLLSFLLLYGPLSGLLNWLIYGPCYGLIHWLVGLTLAAQTADICLTEHVRWTWRSLRQGLFHNQHLRLTLLLTFLCMIFVGLNNTLLMSAPSAWVSLSYGLSTGLNAGLSYWLLFGLWSGITQEQIDDQDRHVPNQGIQRSLRHSVMMGLISGAIIGGISLLSVMLNFALRGGLDHLLFALSSKRNIELSISLNSGLNHALSDGLSYALLTSVSGALLLCLLVGGLATWRHYLIRFLLGCTHTFPWNASQFLDDAVACILLQRLGGGYRFTHRLLLDYFVATRESDV